MMIAIFDVDGLRDDTFVELLSDRHEDAVRALFLFFYHTSHVQ